VRVMRALWADGVASYDGEFVQLAPSRSWPKPLQHPGPPILLGGPANERNFARVARFADGWITMGEAVDRDSLATQVDDLRRLWAAAGRGEHGPRVNLIHNPVRDAPPLDDVIAIAAELGIERVLYHVFEGDRDAMLRRLDRVSGVHST
jgi:alkanesulfonate monooxygenase SsuD/methylene tetrahydromethanopterin reductase-like flavin-dependent oxidoreductase (luciferase family)